MSKDLSETPASRAAAINELGFKLLAQLVDRNASRNVFISPAGINFSLSILLNGANGETKTALAKLLSSDTKALDSFNFVNRQLHSQLERKISGAQIHLANGLFTNAGRTLNPSFSKIVEHFYRAQTSSGDLNSAAGAEAINDWVREQTHGRIQSVIEESDLQPPVSCIIISALHYVGTWATPFDPEATRDGTFFLPGKRKKSIPIMSQTDAHPYYQDDTVQIIQLAYGESGFSAYFVLPSPRVSLSHFLTEFDAQRWTRLISLLIEKRVELRLPRFGLTYDTDLSHALAKLGLSIAFNSAADFSPMGLSDDFITRFKHKTIATVDEKGTKAAAVSTIMMGRSLFSPQQMLINRPFLWAVRHDASGALLFLAAVLNPS
jgi:serine protease inhibitor